MVMGKEIYHGKLSKIIFNKEKLKECSSDFSFKTKTYNKNVKCIKDKTLAKNLKSEYNNAKFIKTLKTHNYDP